MLYSPTLEIQSRLRLKKVLVNDEPPPRIVHRSEQDFMLVRLVATAAPPTPVAIYTSRVCELHDPGERFGQLHPEQPARLSRLIDAMHTRWLPEYGELMQLREPEADVTEEQLLRVHTEAYLTRLKGAFQNSRRPPGVRVNLDMDTVIGKNPVGVRAISIRTLDSMHPALSMALTCEAALRCAGHRASRRSSGRAGRRRGR